MNLCTEKNEHLDIIINVETSRNLIVLSDKEFCRVIKIWRNAVTQ